MMDKTFSSLWPSSVSVNGKFFLIHNKVIRLTQVLALTQVFSSA